MSSLLARMLTLNAIQPLTQASLLPDVSLSFTDSLIKHLATPVQPESRETNRT